MPNLPPSMQLPPPTSKGLATCEGFIATLPPVNATCDIILALWLLSKEPGDRVSVGLGARLGQIGVREGVMFTLLAQTQPCHQVAGPFAPLTLQWDT